MLGRLSSRCASSGCHPFQSPSVGDRGANERPASSSPIHSAALIVSSRLNTALPDGIQWNGWRSRRSWQNLHTTAADRRPMIPANRAERDLRGQNEGSNRLLPSTTSQQSNERDCRRIPAIGETHATNCRLIPCILVVAKWKSQPGATAGCFRLCTRAKDSYLLILVLSDGRDAANIRFVRASVLPIAPKKPVERSGKSMTMIRLQGPTTGRRAAAVLEHSSRSSRK